MSSYTPLQMTEDVISYEMNISSFLIANKRRPKTKLNIKIDIKTRKLEIIGEVEPSSASKFMISYNQFGCYILQSDGIKITFDESII